ncbi:MAG TPA: cytochrome c biogenesis protein ResB [Candidatus Limnocylindrales bacterium]|nr:cytochrome c biogenesis protein ResB [Candidatus Limnocylindrales bacterium]
MATLTIDRPAGRAGPSFPARLGMRIWRLFTSVNFAVVQIVAVAVLASFGMTIRQLPGFAFRSPGDYATEMDKLRTIYEPVLGVGLVDFMERLQLFHVFTSTPFTVLLLVLAISIFICTIDRTPRLWQQSAFIRVAQPPAYFDPRLPDRASIAAGPGLTSQAVSVALRRHHFVVREEAGEDGARYVYGDRNRWTKMATLISHLGLILFVVAGLVTAKFGDEQGLVVAEGDTLTVQPIGTPGLLLVKNYAFSAPGLDTGSPTDFTTDLGVFRDGVEVARKVIRVNDPLTVDGYTFHQNGFGPAPDVEIQSTTDNAVLWSGPIPLTDSAGGLPLGAIPIPGKPFGLEFTLVRNADGVGALVIVPYAVRGTNPDGTPDLVFGEVPYYATRGDTVPMEGLGLSLTLRDFSDFTLLIAKKDPGAPIVWGAFATLLLGLAITFYLPRRRIWARLRPDGRLDLVGRADRQVDFDREFTAVIDSLVAARGGPASPPGPAAPGPAAPGPDAPGSGPAGG